MTQTIAARIELGPSGRPPKAVTLPRLRLLSASRKGIFATVPFDEQHLHVLVDAEEAMAAVAEDSTAFAELWWGSS